MVIRPEPNAETPSLIRPTPSLPNEDGIFSPDNLLIMKKAGILETLIKII